MLHARTARSLHTTIEQRVRDTQNRRWPPEEVYVALNLAIDTWSGRVSTPFQSRVTFLRDQSGYDIPWYVVDDKFSLYIDTLNGERREINSARILNTQAGKRLYLSNTSWQGDAIIEWWAPVPRVPALPVSLADDVAVDATEIVTTSEEEPDKLGYVRIDREWIQYVDTEQNDDGHHVLKNCVRGVLGTAPASHVAATEEGPATPVDWGVVVHRADLFGQLQHQAIAYLHEMFLGDGSPRETEVHERLINWHTQQANEYWRRYYPNWPGGMRVEDSQPATRHGLYRMRGMW